MVAYASSAGDLSKSDVCEKVSLGGLMDYDAWQSVLSGEFFPMTRPDEPVIIFVDDEELSRICPLQADPVNSLRSAVLFELRQTDKSTIFDRIHLRLAAWRKGAQDQAPPCLPLLAVTVLAASRMRSDGNFSSAAYYPRLISLMTSGPNSLTAEGIKKHFDQVAEMWQMLDTWIESKQDAFGISTIHTHETFNRIGYPLSQTVLKSSDRDKLSLFLDRLDDIQRSNLSTVELLHLLRLWLDKPRGFSKAFVELIQKGEGNPLLLAVISKLAAGPPVALPASEGRIRLDLRMCIDPADWSISWVVPVDSRLEADQLEGDGGTILSIRRPEYGTVYDIVGGSLPGAPLIDQRLRASGARAVVGKQVHQLWILRMNSTSGNWQSVNDVILGEQHLLVVKHSDVDELDALLAKNARPGYWKFRRTLFPGWAVYVDVSLIGPIDLTEAGSFTSLGQLLKTPLNTRPKFANGLELRTVLGGRHYLRGGEPDIQMPEESPDGFVQISLDGRLNRTRTKANGSLFPLRIAESYAEGKHIATVGEYALEFFVHTGENASRLSVESTPDREVDVVTDARKSAGPAQYVYCRRGRGATMWFMDASGKVRNFEEILDSALVARLGFPKSYQWKVAAPQKSCWVLVERAGKFSQPQKLTSDRPNFGSLDRDAQAFWRRAAGETIGFPDPLWREYLSQSMEGSINGR